MCYFLPVAAWGSSDRNGFEGERKSANLLSTKVGQKNQTERGQMKYSMATRTQSFVS